MRAEAGVGSGPFQSRGAAGCGRAPAADECDLAAADAGVEGLLEPESNTPVDHSANAEQDAATGEAIASGDQRRWGARACSTRSRPCRCRARRPPRPRGREHRIARMVSVPRLRDGRRPGRSVAARAEATIGVVFVFAGGTAPLEGDLHDDSISQPARGVLRTMPPRYASSGNSACVDSRSRAPQQ